MAARLTRGFPPSGIRPSLTSALVPCPKSGCCITTEQGATVKGDDSLLLAKMEEPDELPPALAPLRAAAVGSSGSPAAAAACGGENAVASYMSQPQVGSSASGNVSGCGDLRQQQQQVQQQRMKKKPQVDIDDMVDKARKASDNIRLLLHAKVRRREETGADAGLCEKNNRHECGMID